MSGETEIGLEVSKFFFVLTSWSHGYMALKFAVNLLVHNPSYGACKKLERESGQGGWEGVEGWRREREKWSPTEREEGCRGWGGGGGGEEESGFNLKHRASCIVFAVLF